MPPTRGWKILLDIDLSPRSQDKLSEKLLQVSRVNCHRGRGLCLSCVIWSVRVYTKTHAVEQNAHTRESQSEKTESKRKPNAVDNKTVLTTWLSWLFWSLNSHTGKSSISFFFFIKRTLVSHFQLDFYPAERGDVNHSSGYSSLALSHTCSRKRESSDGIFSVLGAGE